MNTLKDQKHIIWVEVQMFNLSKEVGWDNLDASITLM